MSHPSFNLRLIIWVIGTLIAIVGAAEIAFSMSGHAALEGSSFFICLSLVIGGFAAIVISETVHGIGKTQVEMDRDAAITVATGKRVKGPITLAICPRCNSRIPSDSKYCLECGSDIKPRAP